MRNERNNIMEQLYSVKKKSGRYIVWCDEHWYETVEYPYPHFSKAEAEAIVKQMRNHYCYDAVIEDKDGNLAENPAAKPIPTEIKKSFFKKF